MKQQILFLTLETFSRTGGIQQVCRNLAKALHEACAQMTLYSVCDSDRDLLEKYLEKPRFRGFRRNKLAFVFQTFCVAPHYQTLVLAHIHLLPVAYMIKLLYPTKRIIMLAHGIEVWKQLNSIQRYFLNKHTEIWAVSAFTKSKMVTINKIHAGKIKVLHNCLDPFFQPPEKFEKPGELLKRYGICKDQPVILSVCRLSHFEQQKGYDSIIQVIPYLLQSLPALRYLIAGPCDFAERQRIEALIGKLGLEAHVHLLGTIDEKELTGHYLLADVFALPSQKEGFGLVLIEAAACGCMVVGGNTDGSAEALLGGKIGRLVDPKDTDQLTKTLRTCLLDLSRAHSTCTQRLTLESFSFSRYQAKVQMLLS
jgi:phosphatidylinositol alpha-1,6-mannosyltransferase